MRVQRPIMICFGVLFTILILVVGQPAQAIETAGTLFVNLSAQDPSAGTASWVNSGTLGDFTEAGDPIVNSIGGLVPAVLFNGTDDAYVSLDDAPAGLVGLDPTRSIEAWVFNPSIAGEETIASFGHRGGPDGTNMSFNYGTNGAYGAVGHWGSPDLGWNDAGGAPTANEWHHLVYTYDGTTTRVYADGALSNSEVLGAGVIDTHAGTKIAVASQFETDGVTLTPGLKGSYGIGSVRIHDGVLSDAQILSNYNEEVGSYPNPVPPPEPEPEMLPASPMHRWSFSNDPSQDAAGAVLVDSIGGADGVVQGAGATLTGTQLTLPGGASATQAYGDLPNGLISGLTDATLEGWITLGGSQTWSRVIDFGSSEPGGAEGEVTGPGGGGAGLDYLMVSAQIGDDVNQQRIEFRNEDPAGGGISTADAATPTTSPQDSHFALVYDSDGDALTGGPVVSFYRDGELKTSMTPPAPLSEINDVNNWLGRSNWTADANFEGSFDEFRIYDYALSQNQVLGNVEAGADVVNVVPEPGSLALLFIAFGGALTMFRRRRRTVC